MSENLPAKEKKSHQDQSFNQRASKSEEPESIRDPDTFFNKKYSWEVRKKFALENIKFEKELYQKAYDGEVDYFKKKIQEENKIIEDWKKNKNMQTSKLEESTHNYEDIKIETERQNPGPHKNNDNKKPSSVIIIQNKLKLSPLIYAIWGEEERNKSNEKERNESDEEEKNEFNKEHKKISESLSQMLIKHCHKLCTDEIIDLKIYDNFYIKNEIGHALGHEILPEKYFFSSGQYKIDISYWWYEKIIKHDYHFSLSYLIQKQKFEIKKLKFEDIVSKDEEISIINFAVRSQAVKCLKILFYHIKNNIAELKSEELKIIESEFSEYLKVESSIVKIFLDGITESQTKSFEVNIENIPQFKTISSEKPNRETLEQVKKEAFNSFDDMDDHEDFINSKIINSKIKLPTLIGSTDSLNCIQTLAETTDLKLFNIDLIKYYLDYKWSKLRYLILVQSILRWVTIPMITYLVLINKYDRAVLAFFTLINIILIFCDLLRFISILINYHGSANKMLSWVIIRLISIPLIFLSNFQPCSCIIYLTISSFLIQKTDGFKWGKFCEFNGVLVIYILLIFPGFWAKSKIVWVLMIAFGSIFLFLLILAIIFVSKENPNRVGHEALNQNEESSNKNDKSFNIKKIIIELLMNDNFWFVICWGFKTSLFAMLLIIISLTEYNNGIMILTGMISAILVVSHIHQCSDNWKKIILHLLICLIFSFNFYTNNAEAYYSLNSIDLILTSISIYIDYKKFLEIINHTENILIAFILVSSTLTGLNVQDSISLKVIVLIIELTLFIIFVLKNKIKLNTLQSIFMKIFINWNSITLVQIILCIFWLNDQYSFRLNLNLTYLFVILILLRGLTSFRCFSTTRYYVALIFHIINEIFPFLLIFFYTTFSFGAINSLFEDISIIKIWIYPYDLSIGSPSHTNNFDINYITYLVTTIINVVIMLNLLISILGDNFDRFQIYASELDYLEMAITIAEFEHMVIIIRILKENETGEYLLGILEETPVVKKKGKVVRDELYELREKIENLDKYFLKFKENFEDCKINEQK